MLTDRQQELLEYAFGDGLNWPKITNDPEVNCAVDVIVAEATAWRFLSVVEKQIYIIEAKKVK